MCLLQEYCFVLVSYFTERCTLIVWSLSLRVLLAFCNKVVTVKYGLVFKNYMKLSLYTTIHLFDQFFECNQSLSDRKTDCPFKEKINSSYNYGHNIWRIFDVLRNVPFTTSETKPDY